MKRKRDTAKQSHYSHEVFKKTNQRGNKMSENAGNIQAELVSRVPEQFAIELNFCTQNIRRAEAEVAAANMSLQLEKERQQGQLLRMYAKLKLDPDDHFIVPNQEGLVIMCKTPKAIEPPVDPPQAPSSANAGDQSGEVSDQKQNQEQVN